MVHGQRTAVACACGAWNAGRVRVSRVAAAAPGDTEQRARQLEEAQNGARAE